MKELFLTDLEQAQDNCKGLKMLLQLNKCLSSNQNVLPSKELLILVNVTRRYLQTFHNDQVVCEKLLEGIQLYIRMSGTIPNDATMEEARLTLIKMIEIFLSVGSTKYSPRVRSKIVQTLFVIPKSTTEEETWKIEFELGEENGKHLVCAFDIILTLLMTDPSYLVQHYICQNMHKLLTKLKAEQVKKLQNLLKEMTKHDMEMEKEKNQISIQLFVVKNIIIFCPILEKQSLLTLIESARNGSIQHNAILKVTDFSIFAFTKCTLVVVKYGSSNIPS
ncbi:uncharacterized protein [Clytia hemisphaerica]|uniref:uncharacterized protein n=1 Tax=Clytia hemisphaerica TaxID=252671 RepID=UPI0034D70FF1